MTTYLIVLAAIVLICTVIVGFQRRSLRLSSASAKNSADVVLRKLYSQYWAQATTLTQACLLDAPSDEQWLAEIRMRAFADPVQREPVLWRVTGFLPALATGHGRLRRRCSSILRHRGITAAVGALTFILFTSGTFAVVSPRPVSPYLMQANASPASYGVQFPPGQFALSNADRDILDGLVNTIKQSSTRVTVRGYADDLGTPAADHELALKRAQAVVAFLQTHGISKSRLLAQGVRLHVPGPVSRSVTIFVWEDPGNG
jgi:outer membrane protein OmpA-like peptidoglycan-associated protein